MTKPHPDEAVTRLTEFIHHAVGDALDHPLFTTNEPPSDESFYESTRHYLDRLKERGVISGVSFSTEDTSPEDIAAGRVILTISGPPEIIGGMLLQGRMALPCPVEQEPPADLDPRLVAAMDDLQGYYSVKPAWGAVHIVLDDGNVSDADVDFCIQWAKENDDVWGQEIAELLRQVSPEQRMKLHRWWYGRADEEETEA